MLVFQSVPVGPDWPGLLRWNHLYGRERLVDEHSLWGGPCGTLFRRAKEGHHSWEPEWLTSSGDQNSARRNQYRDPYHIPELQPMLHKRRDMDPTRKNRQIAQAGGPTDRFMGLPQEILSMIMAYLPTKDALTARLASRAMARIYLDQQFWASRFKLGAECGLIFEARPIRTASRNWRSLRRSLTLKEGVCGWYGRRVPGALMNRKRIWDLNNQLLDLVDLKWADPLNVIEHKYKTAHRPVVNEGKIHRMFEVSAIRLPDTSHICYQRCQIRSTLVKVTAFFFTDISVEYVCGVKLTFSDGETTHLGYEKPHQEYCKDEAEVNGIKGFETIIDKDGICAFKILSEDGKWSRWLGDNVDTPGASTKRLVGDKICSLVAGFDVRLRRLFHRRRLTNTGMEDG